mgnify:CR=1 FL=1
MKPIKKKANVPGATGTQANKTALESNLENPFSTISANANYPLLWMQGEHHVRPELARAIIANAGIGGVL